MISPRTAEIVLAAALQNGGDFAEIFMEDRHNNTLMMRNDVIENVSSGRIHGAGIRVFHNLRCIYAYANDTSLEGLLDCAAKVAAAVRDAQRDADIHLNPQEIPNNHPIKYYPSGVQQASRLALMREATTAMRDVSPEIVQAQSRYIDSDQHVCIANTEGLYVQDRRVWSRLAMIAVASDGKENQIASNSPGAMQGIELFDTLDIPALARGAAESALRMLHAPVCPAGVMPVIISGTGFGGVVFHEACGHSLEASQIVRGSEFAGKLGEKIAADCVTAIDDGTIPNAWGSLNIDDEGTPTNKLVLIENGILKNYMVDKLNGLRLGMPSTGSGRRESYKFAPVSRMRNTYIAAGNDDEDEMIATMGNGLYAVSMGGGSVDPTTGMFNFAVSEGYLIKDGKIDTPVRGASLIGRGSEVLTNIDRVGRDVAHGQGMCGSISGSVPTNVGQPMIRISSLTVGGR